LVEDHPRSIPVKLDLIWTRGSGDNFTRNFPVKHNKKSGKIEKFAKSDPLNKFDRGPPKECSCKFLSDLLHWFQRRSHLKKVDGWTDGQKTDEPVYSKFQ
jgi:hypothetical protein